MEEDSTTYRYDGYCGLYCGACEILNAKSDEDFERVRKIWGFDPEQVHCHGCKTDNTFLNCEKCPIRNCARSKGVEFCLQCGDYPCDIYEGGKEIVKLFPHLKATLRNQRYIHTNGVEKWLLEQKEKWECPQCGSPFTWYMEKCGNCGRDLKGLKDYENLTDEDLAI